MMYLIAYLMYEDNSLLRVDFDYIFLKYHSCVQIIYLSNVSLNNISNLIYHHLIYAFHYQQYIRALQKTPILISSVLDLSDQVEEVRKLTRIIQEGIINNLRILKKTHELLIYHQMYFSDLWAQRDVIKPKIEAQESLKEFFKYLTKNKSLIVEQKKFQWLNAINHLLGKHGLCLHSNFN